MTENNGSGGAPTLIGNWMVVLLGSRTLLGVLHAHGELDPVYQIEVRPVPVQGIDPQTKQPTMGMVRQRHLSAPAEITGWTSLILPQGVVLKPVDELPIHYQREMAQLVANYEAAVSAAQRKQRIDQEAAEASKAMSFGGGARKE